MEPELVTVDVNIFLSLSEGINDIIFVFRMLSNLF